jgi:hypothetical protein
MGTELITIEQIATFDDVLVSQVDEPQVGVEAY